MNNSLLTFDIDWAPDFVIDKIAEMLIAANVKATWFVTHSSKAIDGLRNILKKYLPEEYVSGVKQGFSAPDASWFRGDSIDYVKELLYSKDARIYAYLRHDTVTNLVDEHLEGKQNRRLLIWSLISFEWWLRKFS